MKRVRDSYKLVDVIKRMTEKEIVINDHKYVALQCDSNYPLSGVWKGTQNIILIRQCVLEQFQIASSFHTRCSNGNVLFAGTPGIGKTISIIVWLYQIIVKKAAYGDLKCILLDRKGSVYRFRKVSPLLWGEPWWSEEEFDTLANARQRQNDGTTLYLFDAREQAAPNDLSDRWSCVVFSSPNKAHFKEYIKSGNILEIMFVPVWKWREIDALYKLGWRPTRRTRDHESAELTLDEIRKIYFLWGGVPREFCRTAEDSLLRLNSVIKGVDVNLHLSSCREAHEFIEYSPATADALKSRLIHIIPSNDYTIASMTFGSSKIREALIARSQKSVNILYREFVTQYGLAEYASTMRGHLYEYAVLHEWQSLNDPNANEQVLTYTVTGDHKSRLSVMSLPLLAHPSKKFADLDEIIDTDRLWIPMTSNFKSFDAFLTGKDRSVGEVPAQVPPALAVHAAATSVVAAVDEVDLQQHPLQALLNIAGSPPPPSALPPKPPVYPFLVQITVGKTHSLNVTGVQECVKHFGVANPKEIVFCLPPQTFQHWYLNNSAQLMVTKKDTPARVHQSLQEMTQRVICMPCDATERLVVDEVVHAVWRQQAAEAAAMAEAEIVKQAAAEEAELRAALMGH